MTPADVDALQTQFLWAVFGLALAFGVIAQRGHFCTMGAVADVVNIGDWTRMRMWVLAIAVAMLGFNAMVGLGWIKVGDTFYSAPRVVWLSNLFGGFLFGVGMVLGSGCGSKTLVRIGGGSLKAVVVFCVLGLAAFATMRGITAVARVATVDTVSTTLATTQDLPTLAAAAFGASATSMVWIVGGALGLALIGWVVARPEGRAPDTLLAGVGLGAVVVGVWWVSGRLGFVPEDPQTLEPVFLTTNSGRMESLTFVAPMAYTLDWLIYFSDASKVLTLAIVSTVGVVVGSAVHAVATRNFRWEGFRDAEDTANHLVGAVLMGVGGVTAMGCTIGQGLTGLSTLSLGSFVAFAGILVGAVAGLRWQTWRIERQM
jgi:uncharacterized protein